MIEQRVTLRYDAQQIPAIVQAVQGDTGRDVIFELADYEIPAGATANYYIDKPDGNAVYNSAEVISSTEILAHLTEQALAGPGRNNGQVRILSDGEVITSFDFVLEVEVFRGILRLQSETEINIFDAAIQDAVDDAIEEIQAQTPVVTGMQNSIAPTYSSSSTYAVGDYVMYNAQLYKCNTAITTEEAWTGAHWTQVPLANDIKADLSETNERFKPLVTIDATAISDDLAEILQWKQGSISSTGVPTTSSTRIYSSMFSMDGYDSITVSCNDGYKFALEQYDSDGNFVYEVPFQTAQKAIIDKYYYRILLAKTDNSAITPSDNQNISIVTLNNIGLGIKANTATNNGILSVVNDLSELQSIDYSVFTIANLLNSSGTPEVQKSNRKRVTTETPIRFKAGTKIGLSDYSTYNFYLAYGNDDSYTFTTTFSTDFIIPVDCDCYICIVKASNETNVESPIDYASKLVITRPIEKDFKEFDTSATIKNIEPGSISGTGVDTSAGLTIRRRTKKAFAEAGSVLSVPDQFEEFYFEVMTFNSDGTISESSWLREYRFETDAVFRLIVRKTDNSAWSSADETEYKNTVRFANNPTNFYFANKKENIRSICHAGLDGAPENTIPAFIAGYNAGFTIMECDSRVTSDGVFVLLHDATINRTARNADGTTISETLNVADLTYAELQEYDFGIWKGSQYAGTKIPKSEDAFKLFRALNVGVYVDIATYPTFTKEQIWELMDIVNACGMHDNATYVCQSGYASYIIEKDLTANIAFTSNAQYSVSAACCLTGKNSVLLSAQYDTITQAKIDNAEAIGMPMEAWTVTGESSQESVDQWNYLTGITGTINPAQKYYKEKALE